VVCERRVNTSLAQAGDNEVTGGSRNPWICMGFPAPRRPVHLTLSTTNPGHVHRGQRGDLRGHPTLCQGQSGEGSNEEYAGW